MDIKKIIKDVQFKARGFTCKHCSESGCSDGDYHDKMLIEEVVKVTIKLTKSSKPSLNSRTIQSANLVVDQKYIANVARKVLQQELKSRR